MKIVVVVVGGGGLNRVAESETHPLPLTVMPSPLVIGSGPGTSNSAQPLTFTSLSRHAGVLAAAGQRPGCSASPDEPDSSFGVMATTGPSAWPPDGGTIAPIVTASSAEAAASRAMRSRRGVTLRSARRPYGALVAGASVTVVVKPLNETASLHGSVGLGICVASQSTAIEIDCPAGTTYGATKWKSRSRKFCSADSRIVTLLISTRIRPWSPLGFWSTRSVSANV